MSGSSVMFLEPLVASSFGTGSGSASVSAVWLSVITSRSVFPGPLCVEYVPAGRAGSCGVALTSSVTSLAVHGSDDGKSSPNSIPSTASALSAS